MLSTTPPSDTLLQNMKDSLVVTAAGAEVLPFLAAYAVLPASITFYVYHSNLVRADVVSEVWIAAGVGSELQLQVGGGSVVFMRLWVQKCVY